MAVPFSSYGVSKRMPSSQEEIIIIDSDSDSEIVAFDSNSDSDIVLDSASESIATQRVNATSMHYDSEQSRLAISAGIYICKDCGKSIPLMNQFLHSGRCKRMVKSTTNPGVSSSEVIPSTSSSSSAMVSSSSVISTDIELLQQLLPSWSHKHLSAVLYSNNNVNKAYEAVLTLSSLNNTEPDRLPLKNREELYRTYEQHMLQKSQLQPSHVLTQVDPMRIKGSSFSSQLNINASTVQVSAPIDGWEMRVKKVFGPRNCCLFNSILFLQAMHQQSNNMSKFKVQLDEIQRLRRVASSAIKRTIGSRGAPITLEVGKNKQKTIQEYCEWILEDNVWGGELELACLADHFKAVVIVVSMKKLPLEVNCFGDRSTASHVMFLAYNGSHYEPLVLANQNQSKTVGVFVNIKSDSINTTSQSIYQQAVQAPVICRYNNPNWDCHCTISMGHKKQQTSYDASFVQKVEGFDPFQCALNCVRDLKHKAPKKWRDTL